jgi:tryptophanase
LNKLEKVLQENPKEKIPLILITITNNTAGGQPVSMQNMREVSALGKKYGVPVFIDAARYAENAYFIKVREKGYADKSIKEIIFEMFSYAEGCTMSSKKDGIVNIGGFIGLRSQETFRDASTFNIIYEGFITYGGMAGRDMGALAQGLRESAEFSYLESRIGQVAFLGSKLKEFGIPVQEPFGGHAIFVDAKKMLPNVPQNEYTAQLLAVELYIEAGVRGVEIGTLLADRDPETRENRYPKLEMLRLAIPRRVYSNNHMEYVAVALKNVFNRREELNSGFNITWEAPIMRHFTVELERKNK